MINFLLENFKDKYTYPEGGYRDINIVVETKTPNGEKVLAEIQLNTKEMLDAKDLETPLYNKKRILEAKKEAGEILTDQEELDLEQWKAESLQIYKEAWNNLNF